jgi:hypothetical protein
LCDAGDVHLHHVAPENPLPSNKRRENRVKAGMSFPAHPMRATKDQLDRTAQANSGAVRL